jgi:2,4-dienoyl-CoA reductase-like NADH-dependent reductase (Old Yellow Enzyme family)
MPRLFDPLDLRSLTLRNRLAVSPMCQYSAAEGVPGDWHLVHLGSRAVGGAGLVFTEASAVEPRGRISPADTGLWNDRQAEAWARIARFVTAQGAAPCIQLAHAGRKASTARPWDGGAPLGSERGGWETVAPSAIAFAPGYPTPRALGLGEIGALVRAFRDAAVRAREVGFQAVEIHSAHGYLLHEFLSPLTNHRSDEFGGSFENRVRLILQVANAIRAEWPERLPLFVRLSTTDWAPGGWEVEQSIELARRLREVGVDVVDCSSGGAVADAKVPAAPGYQVPAAERIRREAGVATMAVGLITEPEQADRIVREGQADLVALGREELRDPHFPLRAARVLGLEVAWPPQYLRAKS